MSLPYPPRSTIRTYADIPRAEIICPTWNEVEDLPALIRQNASALNRCGGILIAPPSGYRMTMRLRDDSSFFARTQTLPEQPTPSSARDLAEPRRRTKLKKPVVFDVTPHTITLADFRAQAHQLDKEVREAYMLRKYGRLPAPSDPVLNGEALEEEFWHSVKYGSGPQQRNLVVTYGVDIEAEGAYSAKTNKYASANNTASVPKEDPQPVSRQQPAMQSKDASRPASSQHHAEILRENPSQVNNQASSSLPHNPNMDNPIRDPSVTQGTAQMMNRSRSDAQQTARGLTNPVEDDGHDGLERMSKRSRPTFSGLQTSTGDFGNRSSDQFYTANVSEPNRAQSVPFGNTQDPNILRSMQGTASMGVGGYARPNTEGQSHTAQRNFHPNPAYGALGHTGQFQEQVSDRLMTAPSTNDNRTLANVTQQSGHWPNTLPPMTAQGSLSHGVVSHYQGAQQGGVRQGMHTGNRMQPNTSVLSHMESASQGGFEALYVNTNSASRPVHTNGQQIPRLSQTSQLLPSMQSFPGDQHLRMPLANTLQPGGTQAVQFARQLDQAYGLGSSHNGAHTMTAQAAYRQDGGVVPSLQPQGPGNGYGAMGPEFVSNHLPLTANIPFLRRGGSAGNSHGAQMHSLPAVAGSNFARHQYPILGPMQDPTRVPLPSLPSLNRQQPVHRAPPLIGNGANAGWNPHAPNLNEHPQRQNQQLYSQFGQPGPGSYPTTVGMNTTQSGRFAPNYQFPSNANVVMSTAETVCSNPVETVMTGMNVSSSATNAGSFLPHSVIPNRPIASMPLNPTVGIGGGSAPVQRLSSEPHTAARPIMSHPGSSHAVMPSGRLSASKDEEEVIDEGNGREDSALISMERRNLTENVNLGGKAVRRGRKRQRSDALSHVGNINQFGILRHLSLLPGINHPMFYVGAALTRFAWHTEDAFLNSASYLHHGSAPKYWYTVPPEHAEKLEQFAKEKVFSKSMLHGDKAEARLLMGKTTMLDPLEMIAYGINVHRIEHKPGSIVVTAPRGYHAGFNAGYNVAEAVNFAGASWFPVGVDAAELGRTVRVRLPVPREALLYFEARDLFRQVGRHGMESVKGNLLNIQTARVLADHLGDLIQKGEEAIRKYAHRSGCKVMRKEDAGAGFERCELVRELPWGITCGHCMETPFFYAAVCLHCQDFTLDGEEKPTGRCHRHFGAGKICKLPGHETVVVRRHDPIHLIDTVRTMELISGKDVSLEARYARYEYLREDATPVRGKESGLRIYMDIARAFADLQRGDATEQTGDDAGGVRKKSKKEKKRKRKSKSKRKEISPSNVIIDSSAASND